MSFYFVCNQIHYFILLKIVHEIQLFMPKKFYNASFMSLLWIWHCTAKSYQINVCKTCQTFSITAKLVRNLLNSNCFASNDIISHPHFCFPVTPLEFAPFFLKLTKGKGFLGVCSLNLRHETNIYKISFPFSKRSTHNLG